MVRVAGFAPTFLEYQSSFLLLEDTRMVVLAGSAPAFWLYKSRVLLLDERTI